MVLTKKLYTKRGKPKKIIASLSNKSHHNTEVHTLNDFTKGREKPSKYRTMEINWEKNLILTNGLFTSYNVTLQETSINNEILRIPLKRHTLNDLNVSSFGRSIKRKGNFEHLSSQNHTYKKLNINGSSMNKHIHNFKNSVAEKSKLSISIPSSEKQHLEKKNNSKTKQSKTKGRPFLKNVDKTQFKKHSIINRHNLKEISRSFNVNGSYVKEGESEFGNQKNIQECKYEVQLPKIGMYFLKFKKDKIITEGTLNFKFHKLVTDVKNIKLPTVTWKIKVVLKQNKISSITFTNKQELERSVCFSTVANKFKLLIDNKPAYLLGSPKTIDAPEDIEILLDILEHLEDTGSQIILYK